MKRAFLLLLLIITYLLSSHPSLAQQKWIGAYYLDYAPSAGNIYPENLDFTGITHVYHLGQNATQADPSSAPYFSMVIPAHAADSAGFFWSNGHNIVHSLITHAHAKGTKVLVTLGCGWGEPGNNVLSDSSKTQTMVNSVVAFAKRHNYDGIDVDWESSDLYGHEAAYMDRLVRILRRRISSQMSGGLLTLAVNDGMYGAPTSTVADSIDQLNLMSYGMTNNNDQVTALTEPIYAPPASVSTSLHNWQDNLWGTWDGTDYPTIHNGPRFMVQNGWPSSKVGVGIGTYGYAYVGFTVPGQAGGQGHAGLVSYEMADSSRHYGGTYHWIDTSKVPWIGGTANHYMVTPYHTEIRPGQTFYITHEDTNSIKAKIDWIKNQNFGGTMFYDFYYGWVRNKPALRHEPLIDVAIRQMRAKPPSHESYNK